MRYLLTGAAGFIASRVAEFLLDDGHEVVGADDLNPHNDVRLKRWRLERLRTHKGFAFTEGDVSDRHFVNRLFEGGPIDAVLNLAARAGVRQSMVDPWAYVQTNVTGTLNLLEGCRRHDVPTFLLSSTSSLYGAHNPRPWKEDADTKRPLSPYAASKRAAESFVATYAHLYGLNAPTPRYFTVYGPGGRLDMAPMRFVKWIREGDPVVMYGDGSQERDFTFVDDIARGTIAALRVDGFEIINLGNDEPVKLSTFIEEVERATGRQAVIDRRPDHKADVQATWADITKARRLLSWSPKVGLAEGLSRTVAWYEENRAWARELDYGAT